MLTGGCHCGAIRYEAEGDIGEAALCHCADCRRTTGAPAIAWFTVPSAGFRIIKGDPAMYRSSAHAARSFCPRCGAQMTFIDDAYAGERVDVTAASLDDPTLAAPREHIWTRSRIAWMTTLGSLPERTMEERP